MNRKEPNIPFGDTSPGAQQVTGLFRERESGELFFVRKPFSPSNPNITAKRVAIYAGAFTHDKGGHSYLVAAEFRIYAYILGYRLAESGLGEKFKIDLIYGGGENGCMGDLVWGCRDAYASKNLPSSNVIAYDTEAFWEKRDNIAEINRHLKAIITCKSFSLRKRMLNTGVNILLILAGGIGSIDEMTTSINEAQQADFSGRIIIANQPIIKRDLIQSVMARFFKSGYYDEQIAQLKTTYDQGFTSKQDHQLFSVIPPSYRLDKHIDRLLDETFLQMDFDPKNLPPPTPVRDIIQSYIHHHQPRRCADNRPIRHRTLQRFGFP